MGKVFLFKKGFANYGLLFLLTFFTIPLFSQSLNFISTQSNLPYLDAKKIAAGNMFTLQISNPRLVSGKTYKLGIIIEGKGIQIKSSPDFYPPAITVDGTPFLMLNAYDLSPYFDIANLDFSGITKEEYEIQGGLPDGLYSVCFQLFDNTADAYFAVGQKSCLSLWMKREDPPKITTPVRTPVIDHNKPYNITWMARHLVPAVVQYNIEIYENDPALSYIDIMTYHSPVLRMNTPNNLYQIPQNNPTLKLGRSYFAIVKAESNGLVFKNSGYSDPEYFVYGNESLRSDDTSCPLPSGKVFINEISQGCYQTGYGSREYVELVVVGEGGDDNVNLENFIVDDNNFPAAEIGNEPGHIRLGTCFSAVPKGTIILLYNNDDVNPLINPSNDGTPGAGGWWQIPFNSTCLKKYNSCPDQVNDGYNCPLEEVNIA